MIVAHCIYAYLFSFSLSLIQHIQQVFEVLQILAKNIMGKKKVSREIMAQHSEKQQKQTKQPMFLTEAVQSVLSWKMQFFPKIVMALSCGIGSASGTYLVLLKPAINNLVFSRCFRPQLSSAPWPCWIRLMRVTLPPSQR